MTTAQTLLTQGNQTQQLQVVTQTFTRLVPWIAIVVLAFLAVKVFSRKK